MAESWDDAAFFDKMGVMRPRTGAVGVPNVGGIASPAAPQQRPVVTQQAPSAPVGRPASSIAPGTPPPSQPDLSSGMGAPAEVSLKFHAPEPPPAPAAPEAPAPNPLGTPLTTADGQTSMLLNPEGMQAHAQAMSHAEALFGPHPFAGDPHAPKPILRPGKPNFNPFLGSWSGGGGDVHSNATLIRRTR